MKIRAIVFSAIFVTAALFTVQPAASAAKNEEVKPAVQAAEDGGKLKISFGKDGYEAPPIVIAPELIPDSTTKLNLPTGMDVREQIAVLAAEIEKLKAQVAKVTLIVSLELQLENRHEMGGVEITISGSRLERPLTCVSDSRGFCVFVVPPVISEKDPGYKLQAERSRYKPAEMKIRPEPGAVAFIPFRMELIQSELDRRINPPAPPK